MRSDCNKFMKNIKNEGAMANWNHYDGLQEYTPDLEFLDCPFCGSDYISAKSQFFDEDKFYNARVFCNLCGAHSGWALSNSSFDPDVKLNFESEKDVVNYAIFLWNMRSVRQELKN